MKRLICLLIALTLWLRLPAAALADPTDTLIREQMQKRHIAGLALMVIKNGEPIKTECYGIANLEWSTPVATNTVFEIGSVTKQFTAACILLLAQDGKLSVDDKISQHLTNTPASWANITVRNLLTHTSGLTNYNSLDGFELRRHLTQAQFIQQLGVYPLNFQPGDSWSYCNSGFNLLGYIVENVSGKSYWDFLRERIFKPLGMDETQNRTPGVVIAHRAAGYEMANHVPINRDYDVTDLFSAGAIVSTLTDLAKWNAALNGEQILNAASKELWWAPTHLNNGKVKEYGFAWFLDSLDGHKNIGHTGETSGFSASIQRFPEDQLSVIMLCNAGNEANALAKKVAKLFLTDAKTK